jgi:hypothetical protein
MANCSYFERDHTNDKVWFLRRQIKMEEKYNSGSPNELLSPLPTSRSPFRMDPLCMTRPSLSSKGSTEFSRVLKEVRFARYLREAAGSGSGTSLLLSYLPNGVVSSRFTQRELAPKQHETTAERSNADPNLHRKRTRVMIRERLKDVSEEARDREEAERILAHRERRRLADLAASLRNSSRGRSGQATEHPRLNATSSTFVFDPKTNYQTSSQRATCGRCPY